MRPDCYKGWSTVRILFATDFTPSPQAPHAGGKLVFHYAQGLRARGCEAAFVCPVRPHERALAEALAAEHGFRVFAAPVERSLLRRARRLWLSLAHPLAYAFVRSIGLPAVVGRALREFQPAIVHAVQPHALEAVDLALAAEQARPARVAHAIDVVAKLHLRALIAAERAGWRYWPAAREASLAIPRELRLYAGAQAVACHTESDRAFLRAFIPGSALPFLLPVWFDACTAILRELPSSPETDNDLLYVGNPRDPRTREALDWLLGEIFPRICARRPFTTLTITGQMDAADQHRWCQAAGVRCPGYVANLFDLYDRSRALIVPLRTGGGIHVKVLNAFARGCPVVMTSFANDGIAARDGSEALIADDADGLGGAALRVLDDPALGRALAEQALVWLRRYAADDIALLAERIYPAALAHDSL